MQESKAFLKQLKKMDKGLTVNGSYFTERRLMTL